MAACACGASPASALLIDRCELVTYGLAAVGLSSISLGIFLFLPTAMPRPEIDWSQHPAFAFLLSVDASGNGCPSLHVAFAVFTAIWFERLLRWIGTGRFVRAPCRAILEASLRCSWRID